MYHLIKHYFHFTIAFVRVSLFFNFLEIQSDPSLAQYRNCSFDAFKIYSQPFQAKSNNLAININDDSSLIQPISSTMSLHLFGITNETEISLFNNEEYKEFSINPKIEW